MYFVTFTITNWVVLFIRNECKEIVLNSIRFCQEDKDLEVYGWVMMTSHLHLIIGSKGIALSNIMRDLKRHSSEMLHIAIVKNTKESRREWLLAMFRTEGEKYHNKSQLWQAESHPIALVTAKIAHQKLTYIHYNPVEAGFVKYTNAWI